MGYGSTKRTASVSPDTRPSKRPATSSPEEGEVDDVPKNNRVRTPSPPSQSSAKFETKVKFPFKRKGGGQDEHGLPLNERDRTSAAQERLEGSERRVWQDDRQRHAQPREQYRRQNRYHWEPSVDRWQSSADHWEPGAGPSRDRDRDGRRMRERERDWDRVNDHRGVRQRPPSSADSRDYSYRDRDRGRAPSLRGRSSPSLSPSPPSYSRSASSGSSRGSGRKKHRLPPTRESLSPARDYRDGRVYTRDKDYYDDDYESRRSETLHHWRGDAHGQYHRSPLEDYNGDRYPRAGYSPRPSYRETQDSRRYLDSYRPSDTAPSRPPPSDVPRSLERRTPPPPESSPPPPPASDTAKSHVLPPARASLSIQLSKKLPTPPPQPPPKPEPTEVRPKKGETISAPKPTEPRRKMRREPVHRSREEEAKAYGRMFVGCGRQEDYDATTKLGEGTFGEVHKAVHRVTGNSVALKRILMHNEKEGMPVTALREIKILKALRHPNIVELLDMFVVRSKGKESPLSVYMVFPYMDHDLAGLLENERVKLQPSQIKLYMKQLLEGTEYMHLNHILHRDMKAANLLISNTGSLRIADFGLARSFDPTAATINESASDRRSKDRRYTNCVVTRWYRPPELLLGARHYGGEIDIWGVGCVLGEMFLRHPILPGSSDLDQLEKIWQMCGTPHQLSWPNFDALPGCEGVKHHNQYPKRLNTVFEQFGPETCDLIDKLLTCNPRNRITASQALEHDYFWTDPLPADPKTWGLFIVSFFTRCSRLSFFATSLSTFCLSTLEFLAMCSLPSYEASHEFDKRGRRQQPHQQVAPPAMAQHPYQDSYRHIPHPNRQPPLQPYFNQGPPPRDSFRPTAIPPNFPPQSLPTHTNFPPHPPQPGFGPPAGYPPPPQLHHLELGPPLHYNPQGFVQSRSHPPPQQYSYPNQLPPWDSAKQQRPTHLPPRPPAPQGRGGGGYQNRDRQSNRGKSNFGDDGGPTRNGGLNYG
ncbi:hypothetical protein EW146_g5193 [Bondarzewia mesenterica]|uniref:Protein kinase domain-containing protein n=1 Tax=Bondarzewia mesenterica TaxID=1095465 RepID=A0A4S4LSU6_9AGAM|nr:hypothetical protein EW146_g5193 [Bondarzewia mesenterica]